MMMSIQRAASRSSVAALTTTTAFILYSNTRGQTDQVTKAEEKRGWKNCWGVLGFQGKIDPQATVGGQVLARQLYHPKLPYPLWDYNWDGKMTRKSTLEAQLNVDNGQVIGTTRHVILIRHGQYDETFKVRFVCNKMTSGWFKLCVARKMSDTE